MKKVEKDVSEMLSELVNDVELLLSMQHLSEQTSKIYASCADDIAFKMTKTLRCDITSGAEQLRHSETSGNDETFKSWTNTSQSCKDKFMDTRQSLCRGQSSTSCELSSTETLENRELSCTESQTKHESSNSLEKEICEKIFDGNFPKKENEIVQQKSSSLRNNDLRLPCTIKMSGSIIKRHQRNPLFRRSKKHSEPSSFNISKPSFMRLQRTATRYGSNGSVMKRIVRKYYHAKLTKNSTADLGAKIYCILKNNNTNNNNNIMKPVMCSKLNNDKRGVVVTKRHKKRNRFNTRNNNNNITTTRFTKCLVTSDKKKKSQSFPPSPIDSQDWCELGTHKSLIEPIVSPTDINKHYEICLTPEPLKLVNSKSLQKVDDIHTQQSLCISDPKSPYAPKCTDRARRLKPSPSSDKDVTSKDGKPMFMDSKDMNSTVLDSTTSFDCEESRDFSLLSPPLSLIHI